MAACAGDIRNTQSEPDMTMNNAQMVEAKLERARLSGCLLMHADLRDSDLTRAILVRANLAKADLRGCNMRGADLTGTNLGGASMEGVVLTGALICSTNFEGANLVGALVDKANLSNSSIRRSAGIRDLGDLNASLAQILSGHAVWTQSGGSTGQRADLGGVDLSGANLRNVDLGAAIMRGAILRWADLSGRPARDGRPVSGGRARGQPGKRRSARRKVGEGDVEPCDACGNPCATPDHRRWPSLPH